MIPTNSKLRKKNANRLSVPGRLNTSHAIADVSAIDSFRKSSPMALATVVAVFTPAVSKVVKMFMAYCLFVFFRVCLSVSVSL